MDGLPQVAHAILETEIAADKNNGRLIWITADPRVPLYSFIFDLRCTDYWLRTACLSNVAFGRDKENGCGVRTGCHRKRRS